MSSSEYIEKLNQFYKLKSDYEESINVEKEKIMKMSNKSIREKRNIFRTLIPKCINCNSPGGSTFRVYKNDKNDRILKAECNSNKEKCRLDIVIYAGNFVTTTDILDYFKKKISTEHEKIILNKNDKMFGILSDDKALGIFEILKENISYYSSIYSEWDDFNEIMNNNKDNKKQLNKKKVEYFEIIEELKEYQKEYNESRDINIIKEVVHLYNTRLKPINSEIHKLTFNSQYMLFDENDRTYSLEQRKNSLASLEFNNAEDDESVIQFKTGISLKKNKQNKTKKMKKNNNNSDEMNDFRNKTVKSRKKITS